jgi:hypothetical protein
MHHWAVKKGRIPEKKKRKKSGSRERAAGNTAVEAVRRQLCRQAGANVTGRASLGLAREAGLAALPCTSPSNASLDVPSMRRAAAMRASISQSRPPNWNKAIHAAANATKITREIRISDMGISFGQVPRAGNNVAGLVQGRVMKPRIQDDAPSMARARTMTATPAAITLCKIEKSSMKVSFLGRAKLLGMYYIDF